MQDLIVYTMIIAAIIYALYSFFKPMWTKEQSNWDDCGDCNCTRVDQTGCINYYEGICENCGKELDSDEIGKCNQCMEKD